MKCFSPILAITQFGTAEYYDGSLVFVCFSLVEDLLPCLFFVASVVIFFIFPLAILICVYALIAKTLMDHPTCALAPNRSVTIPSQSVIKYRKQVIMMLGMVVVAFFICLLPFRALTLWIVIAPTGVSMDIGIENYYNILYFARIMFYVNSAVNPILYNVMSSKFRGGFSRLCGFKVLRKLKRKPEITRKSTTSSTTQTSSQQTSESILKSTRSRYSSSLKEVKEVTSEAEVSNEEIVNKRTTNLAKNAYIRVPIQIVNSINGEKISNGEIYV